jgi:hypothetical protein
MALVILQASIINLLLLEVVAS